MDYVIGSLLVLCPYIFGFSQIDVARDVFLVLGFGWIAYSLLTDYYYSIAKLIPVGVHMILDVAVGIVLMLAPSIYDYRIQLTGMQNAVHYIFGIGAIVLVLVTRNRTRMPKALSGPSKGMAEDGDVFKKAA